MTQRSGSCTQLREWDCSSHPETHPRFARASFRCPKSLQAILSLRKQDAVANINEVDGPKGEGQDALSQPSGFVHTALSRNANGPNRDRLHFLAERVGFEPTVRLNARLISSQVHSTTLPPLRSRSKGAHHTRRAPKLQLQLHFATRTYPVLRGMKKNSPAS